MDKMKQMCDNCPFGHTDQQRHMRNSLRPGRFNEICQSVWRGEPFICHKTTTHDDDGEWKPGRQDKQCAGSLEFLARATQNREQAERRAKDA